MKSPLSVFLLLLLSTQAHATKFAKSQWEDLVQKSELIAYVEPTNVNRIDRSKGFTTARIVKTLKGEPNAQQIQIHWFLAVAITPPISILDRYILFLNKQPDGTYKAASIGNSTWRITTVNTRDDSHNYIDMEGSGLGAIEALPEEIYTLKQKQSRNTFSGPREVKRVSLKQLLTYFEDKKHLSF